MTDPAPPQYPIPPIEVNDWRYLSRYTVEEKVGVVIRRSGIVFNADANSVLVSMTNAQDSGADAIFTDRLADHDDTGLYSIAVGAADTQLPGFYFLDWNFYLDANPVNMRFGVEVGQSVPAYDALDPNMKDIIEQVWGKFADLFDSVEGGPNLQDYFQSKFSRNRVAQLIEHAINTVNSMGQPYTTFTPFLPNQFPIAQYPGLLEDALYIEVLKHLIRSYVEQPSVDQVGHARLDRRDYMQRWQTVYEMELEGFKREVEIFKFGQMSFRPAVLVGGGAYGIYAPQRLSLSGAARGARFWVGNF